jgi:cytochrome c553
MMKRSSLLMTVALALAGQAGLADAADVAAGKAKVEAVCAECHEAADWQDSGEAELAKLIDGVAKGTSKHPKKKLDLTDTDVANIAAYWASAAK